jgi:hypothetical protein
MKQQHTSEKTSRNQVPALHKALLRAGILKRRTKNADLGGGRFDKATEFLLDGGVANIVHDKFGRSEAHNAWAAKAIESGVSTVTVANVLNVIAEPACRAEVIEQAAEAAAVKGAQAYFTVYEGDGSGEPRQSRDGWQENRKLASYVPEVKVHFPHVELRRISGVAVIVAGV